MSTISHSFNVDLATRIGIVDAIMLQHLYFWCNKNMLNKKNIIDGKAWTYNSINTFCSQYPYLTKNQINGALKRLKEKGIIEEGVFNKIAFDKTKWYTITKIGLTDFLKIETDFLKIETDYKESRNEISEIKKPIPDIKTNINTDIKTNSIRSDEKEFSSSESKFSDSYVDEILEKFRDKKEPTLFPKEETNSRLPDPVKILEEEKQRKNSAKKKEPTLTHKMRQAFESYYEAEKQEKYYYTAKDGANLSQISKKIKHSIRQRHGTNYAPSDSEMIESWNFILAKLKSNHNWVYSNLNIPNINSQYNQIIANIKSGSNGQIRNGKGATNEEVAEILKKYDII